MKEANFISLEGIEGSGKTTSLQTINKILDERSIDHINTREPGGTKSGETIREDVYFFKDKGEREIALRFDFTVCFISTGSSIICSSCTLLLV